MKGNGLNVALIYAVTAALAGAAALLGAGRLWIGGMYFLVICVGIVLIELLILRFTRPHVLKRRLDSVNWWDRILVPVIALSIVASAVLSAYDVANKISVLPSWTFFVSLLLLVSSFLITAQAMVAQPPHARDKYEEEPADPKERGPYDTVRFPAMLAVLLGSVAVPLFLGSGIGFLPLIVTVLAVVARVSQEDNWRFNNLDWYFDYTKEVSYRLLPFIW